MTNFWTADAYQQKLQAIEEALRVHWERKACPPSLKEAVSYSLLAPAKRLRPILLLSIGEALSLDSSQLMPWAMALEMIHCYSLIHDDLPAMDDDDFRRGQASNHRVYGEALAILAGDALLNGAFELLMGQIRHESERYAAELLATAAGSQGMIGGQVLDMEQERQVFSDAEACQSYLLRLQAAKTGALLRAACLIPASLAQLPPEQLEAAGRYGDKIGLAFQIQDDLLDRQGDEHQVGKTLHKDQAQGKGSFVDLLGEQEARAKIVQLHQEALEALELCPLAVAPKQFILDLTEALSVRKF